MKSEHDYRSASQRRFRLVYNPAAGIPTEPKNVETRWLDEEEFLCLYRWLECPDAPVHPPYTRAVRILMLTVAAMKNGDKFVTALLGKKRRHAGVLENGTVFRRRTPHESSTQAELLAAE